jgi:hypothetical protein
MSRIRSCFALVPVAIAVSATPARAADQTRPGTGNSAAITLAAASPLVESSFRTLIERAEHIRGDVLRRATLDAITNRDTCVAHRAHLDDAAKDALVAALVDAKLLNPADAAAITGGARAGVFPPLLDDGGACPHLPQRFWSAPGSSFGGHHSYPGGLAVHETFNLLSDQHFAEGYRRVYGHARADGLPVVGREQDGWLEHADVVIDEDLTIAAPIWHDWAKPIVFQWNSDGSEFTELNFGGTGTNDAWGAAGDSRTGAHHIIGVAETMKRGLSPELVIMQASAHSTPTSGNEYKVVNWLRAAAILARIDPVARGYLRVDGAGRLRLPALRTLGAIDLNAAGQTNYLVEQVMHNLSDADFVLTGPVVTTIELVLRTLAPELGYDPAATAKYNTAYRNVALSYLSAERLFLLYSNGGLTAVRAELNKLHTRGIL